MPSLATPTFPHLGSNCTLTLAQMALPITSSRSAITISLIECVVVQTGLSGSGVKCYLSRLQPLLLWFIEAASLIGQLLRIT